MESWDDISCPCAECERIRVLATLEHGRSLIFTEPVVDMEATADGVLVTLESGRQVIIDIG